MTRNPERRSLWRSSVAAAASLVLLSVLPARAAGADASPPTSAALPSAIGDETVFWISVSPRYEETGTVAAASVVLHHCSLNCAHLWVTHDGGATWKRAAASGWSPGRLAITVDRTGHEVFFSSGPSVVRSDDAGENWLAVGQSGRPTPAPTYPSDGAVAVAGQRDYLLRNGATFPVRGSGGTLVDQLFTYAPTYPSAGGRAPVLLSAADPRSGRPIIQRCDAGLACTKSSPLPGSERLSVPPTLLPSDDYADDGVVFAQTERGLYKSLDGGATFRAISIPAPSEAAGASTPMLALSPGYRESGPARSVFAAILRVTGQSVSARVVGGIYRSSDGGDTWVQIAFPSSLDAGATAIAVAPDGRLFAGYFSPQAAGLLCRPDGATWQASCPPGPTAGGVGPGSNSEAGPAPRCGPSRCSSALRAGDRGAHAGYVIPSLPSSRGVASPEAARPLNGSDAWRSPLVAAFGTSGSAAALLAAWLVGSGRRRRQDPCPESSTADGGPGKEGATRP